LTHHSKRVRFYSTVDLVNALEHEKAKGIGTHCQDSISANTPKPLMTIFSFTHLV